MCRPQHLHVLRGEGELWFTTGVGDLDDLCRLKGAEIDPAIRGGVVAIDEEIAPVSFAIGLRQLGVWASSPGTKPKEVSSMGLVSSLNPYPSRRRQRTQGSL